MVNIKFLYNTHPSNYGGGRSGGAIKYIVVHFTGKPGDTANNNATYFSRPIVGKPKTSAHYFVDENEVINTVGEDKVAWHCVEKKNQIINNINSIGIEMCNCTFVNEKVINNTIDLIKWIQDRYKREQGRTLTICRHYDATGKLCPAIFVDKSIKGFNQAYQDFRNKLSMYRFYN